jgi:hypothetical protein
LDRVEKSGTASELMRIVRGFSPVVLVKAAL